MAVRAKPEEQSAQAVQVAKPWRRRPIVVALALGYLILGWTYGEMDVGARRQAAAFKARPVREQLPPGTRIRRENRAPCPGGVPVRRAVVAVPPTWPSRGIDGDCRRGEWRRERAAREAMMDTRTSSPQVVEW